MGDPDKKIKENLNKIDPNTLDFRQDVDPNSLYELSALLGEGSYGAVYRARSREPEKAEEVAIKIIPDADDDLTALWREIRFLQVLRSPFVVSFVESFLYDNELWLVMELCDGGSLYDLKEANKAAFSEEELRGIMAFCVMGLSHLHAQMSIHRDVKSGNILLTRDGRAKLGDFGISAQLTDTIMKRRTVIGSPYWMAPEVIQETSYDGKADIWSLGITLLELCEGSPPYFNVHPMRAIFMISSKPAPTLKEPEKWSSDMQDFVSKCLIKDCDKRYEAKELKNHPWISQIVQAIGSAGNGLPVLEALIERYWDPMEKLRATRFKLPEAMDNEMITDQDLPPVEDQMATIRSNANGIPATRQQIRNASLKKSLTGTFSRSRASSNAPRMIDYDNGGTFIMKTTPTPSYESSNKDDYSSTMIRHDTKTSQNSHNYDDYDSGTLRRVVGPTQQSGTFISSTTDSKDGTLYRRDTSVKEMNNGAEMQAALKYFRDEPLPSLPDSKDSPSTIVRNEEKGKLENEAKLNFPPTPPPRPAGLKVPEQKAYETEIAVLDKLTISNNDEGQPNEAVEELKKEILRQLSALKKQYRQDLEALTNSYEARRKVLKDALINLSTISENG